VTQRLPPPRSSATRSRRASRSRCGRLTTCATAGSACCTCAACPWRGSASSWASAT
jgi:hypothetical protein